MTKFLTGIVYAVGTGLTCLVAWEHAVAYPQFVSGYIGFFIMSVFPQVMAAMVLLVFARERG